MAWSIIPDIVRAGVVEKWEAAENLFTLDDRMDEPAEATVVNCWFCGMSLRERFKLHFLGFIRNNHREHNSTFLKI